MLLFFEVPICDCRPFVDIEMGQLNLPNWEFPVENRDFVRTHGKIIKRNSGGIPCWIGEDRIALANNFLTFAKPIKINGDNIVYKGQKSNIDVKVVSKTFFYDGLGTGKYNIVFKTIPHSSYIYDIDDELVIIRYLQPILKSKVFINSGNQQKSKYELYKAFSKFNSSYYYASTKNSYVKKKQKFSKFIISKKPIIVIELSPNEHINLPHTAKKIYSTQYVGLQLFYYEFEIDNYEIPIWIIKFDLEFSKTKNIRRHLRIFLTRLHTEYQVLQTILEKINIGEISPNPFSQESNNLQQYLKEIKNRIALKECYSISINDLELIEKYVKKSMNIIDPGHYNSVMKAINRVQIRRQMMPQVNQIIYEFFQGDKVMGNKIDIHDNSGENVSITGINYGELSSVVNHFEKSYDYEIISKEINQLISYLDSHHEKDRENITVELEAVKDAAKNDKGKFFELLSKLPKWLFDVVQKLGLGVLIRYLAYLWGF